MDVGANIGLTSYYFSQFAKQVYSLEPSKLHLKAFLKMKQFNDLSNVDIVPCALSTEDGKTKFFHNTNNTMFSLSTVVNDQSDFEEVKTITLETLLKDKEIKEVDLMKLDVEGFESKLLTHESFRSGLSKIKLIIGEWHNWTEMNQHQFKACFEDLGFSFKWLNRTEASIFIAERL